MSELRRSDDDDYEYYALCGWCCAKWNNPTECLQAVAVDTVLVQL